MLMVNDRSRVRFGNILNGETGDVIDITEAVESYSIDYLPKIAHTVSMEVVILDENGNDVETVYLYPMRAYSFQVGGWNGDGDYGCSGVVGLGNVINAFETSTRVERNWSPYFSNYTYGKNLVVEILKEMAGFALAKFGANLRIISFNDNKKLELFAALTYNYVKAIM